MSPVRPGKAVVVVVVCWCGGVVVWRVAVVVSCLMLVLCTRVVQTHPRRIYLIKWKIGWINMTMHYHYDSSYPFYFFLSFFLLALLRMTGHRNLTKRFIKGLSSHSLLM